MPVFVAGGTGHSGSYIIPELIAARVPMALAMLPEPMMLMVVMMCPSLCLDQLAVMVVLA